MPISVACPHCQAKFNAPDSLAGKKFKCPKCQQVGAVPTESPTALWHVQLADGSEFGPVSRTELDEWFREERITSDCRLRPDHSNQWQPSGVIYPSLSSPLARTAPQPAVVAKTPQAAPPLDASMFGDLNNLGVAPTNNGPILASQPYIPNPYDPAPAGQAMAGGAPDESGDGTPMQRIGGFVLILPIIFCCMEMVPGWGFVGIPMILGFAILVVTGIVGGAMCGNRHFIPGAIGGVIGSLGAAIATVALLQNVKETHTIVLTIVGMLGAAPGYVVFLLLKWIQDLLFPAGERSR